VQETLEPSAFARLHALLRGLGRKALKNPEQQIQRAVVAHLRARALHGVVFFHPANGGSRHPVEAAKLSGLGVLPGASDLILLYGGRFHALELKAERGKVSPAQAEIITAVREAGGMAEVATGIDETISILEGWQLLKGKMQ